MQAVALRPVLGGGRGALAATYARGLSAYAGLGHLLAAPDHLREWWGYGAFFLAAALGQALFAVLVLRWPRPWLALVGIAGNLGIVALYVLSRTSGVPAGPHAGRAEDAGFPTSRRPRSSLCLSGSSWRRSAARARG